MKKGEHNLRRTVYDPDQLQHQTGTVAVDQKLNTES